MIKAVINNCWLRVTVGLKSTRPTTQVDLRRSAHRLLAILADGSIDGEFASTRLMVSKRTAGPWPFSTRQSAQLATSFAASYPETMMIGTDGLFCLIFWATAWPSIPGMA